MKSRSRDGLAARELLMRRRLFRYMWGINDKWAVWEINEMHVVRGFLRFRVCRYM